MNYNNICVWDLETTSKFPRTAQIVQIGAVMINRNNLKIVDEFSSNVRPYDMENNIEEDALRVIKKTREEIASYPTPDIVWPAFVNWVNKHNKGKGGKPSPFNAPIPAGYNIIGYDMPIARRYCKKYNVGWDEERQDQKIFSQIHAFDVMHHMWFWFENNPDLPNLRLDTLREYLGFSQESKDGAHDALNDAKDTAQLVIRLFKLGRYMTELRNNDDETQSRRLEMKGSFANATA